ncbi:helix-turn-helix domain-containing protein [Gracilibacillus salitolerans]|uniref:Helix-turn-helix domain-containing protein n=1 Tax=Gracilibacillus salitolerans TaxID=2663022 RepID=A0A5Q2TNQ9_9BACI|nr:winged helix-turn-helix domain-containing protein [Gracilibacillus salitolerans]QGH35653.1 helix-turn-helix domain-containing protein [Gracilibacillus salitolerans]
MNPNVSKIASLLSDPTRSAILLSLMDGSIHPASELASIAKVKPQTASFHLHKMLESNLINVEKHGRHRYYKLINSDVAKVIEQMLSISPNSPVTSFRESREQKAIHFARTCYDHLAGYLGVQITNSLMEQGYIKKVELNFEVTPEGSKFFQDFGINLEEQEKKRRAYARCCLDWSERQHHIAGALGNALLLQMLERKWITRVPNTRAVKVTPFGKAELQKLFNFDENNLSEES